MPAKKPEFLTVDDDVLHELIDRHPDTDVRGSLAREVLAQRTKRAPVAA